jgi:hypothetical protein
MDSIPPATMTWLSPALMDWAASITDLRPDPQTLLIVTAETVAGTPACSAA